MLGMLMESRRKRERSVGGSVVSVVAHAVLVGVAAAATVRSGPAPVPAREFVSPVWTEPPAAPPADRDISRRSTSSNSAPRLPARVAITTAVVAAPVLPMVLDPITFGSPRRDCACEPTSPAPSGRHGENPPFFEWMVDVPATARHGNPTPIYPHPLREASVEGTVLAQFAIDTTGRADMRTFRALSASHALFVQSVRDAVARMRFTPAESQGRRVRVIVQQNFGFRLER